jgi:hypothetical protein
MPIIAIVDKVDAVNIVGVLFICTVELTKRLTSCCISISGDEFDQLYFSQFYQEDYEVVLSSA